MLVICLLGSGSQRNTLAKFICRTTEPQRLSRTLIELKCDLVEGWKIEPLVVIPLGIVVVIGEKPGVFDELGYEKKNEACVQISRIYKGARKDYFKDLGEENGWHIYRSERKRAVSKEQWPRAFRTFCFELSEFDLASILTRDGYRYYVDLGKREYHHLAWSLMLMYYIGSIARYRPVAAETVMAGALRLLISEAVAVCPRQFLYQLTSLITKRSCSVPHASLV